MRLARWTTRRTMTVVAVIALLIAGPAALWRRSARFEAIAMAFEQHQIHQVPFTDLELYLMTTAIQLGQDTTLSERKREADEQRLRTTMTSPLIGYRDHFTQLVDKYKYASAHPWLPVAPDPPSPPPPSATHRKAVRTYLDDWMARAGIE